MTKGFIEPLLDFRDSTKLQTHLEIRGGGECKIMLISTLQYSYKISNFEDIQGTRDRWIVYKKNMSVFVFFPQSAMPLAPPPFPSIKIYSKLVVCTFSYYSCRGNLTQLDIYLFCHNLAVLP